MRNLWSNFLFSGHDVIYCYESFSSQFVKCGVICCIFDVIILAIMLLLLTLLTYYMEYPRHVRIGTDSISIIISTHFIEAPENYILNPCSTIVKLNAKLSIQDVNKSCRMLVYELYLTMYVYIEFLGIAICYTLEIKKCFPDFNPVYLLFSNRPTKTMVLIKKQIYTI